MYFYKGEPVTVVTLGGNLTEICDTDGREFWVRSDKLRDSAVLSRGVDKDSHLFQYSVDYERATRLWVFSFLVSRISMDCGVCGAT